MKKFLVYLFLFLALPASAQMLLSPTDAMLKNYGNKSKISEEVVALTPSLVQKIQESSSVKVEAKKIQLFKATQDGKTIGYGILLNRKIRSKNGVVLYLISKDATLKAIEVIAFNEPLEYIPSKTWMAQFENVKADTSLTLAKNIANITGATLSAKSFVDGSRIALAFYDEILRGK